MAVSDSLIRDMAEYLAEELGDAAMGRALTRILIEDALSWRAPRVAPREVATIVAFTFGNRMQPNGNREPGPVNEELGTLAAKLHAETGAPVYAQWEVAEALGTRVPPDRLMAIYPSRDERAEPVYLSTSGVVREIVRRVGDPAALGKVGIVATADHAWRCIATARRYGLAAALPEGYTMPPDYDPLSGQPWCRSRLAYLLHDIAIRAAERRDMLITQQIAGG